MTEASENEFVVRVRAQVMCRDEGTGGWLALGGGGLADVMVGRKLHVATAGESPAPSSEASPPPATPDAVTPPDEPHAPLYDYYISGRRIQDNMTVLECSIGRDFQYNKVMPTFHHWVTEHKRFGLTFQTAADARAFDKGVRIAIDDIIDGLGGAWPSLHAYKKLYPGPREEDEEQPIFECLNLPSESRSSSENSTASRAKRRPTEVTQTPILSAINLPAHAHTLTESGIKYADGSYDDKIEESETGCPYVHLSAVHDYNYPSSGVISSEKSSPNTKPPLIKHDSGSIKKQYTGPPPLPDKKPTDTFQSRLKCRHCHEWYLESANRAGACEFAPDCFKSCIDCVTCIKCAQGMLYHCMSDAEGDFAMHPCACAAPDTQCAKRWLGLTLLSVIVPCLCCYLPLRAVHRAARATHVAGGLHAPEQVPYRTPIATSHTESKIFIGVAN
ncbi:hypothetical protein O0L34_g18765 [Tuta absoluta]|nr:hypothetical protein O0L34_g18765 [Tuta absoluta]